MDQVLVAGGNFAKFAPAVAKLSLPVMPPGESLHTTDLCLYSDAGVEVYYAPFDDLNRHAKVVLLGITPGRHETEVAYRVAGAGLRAGESAEQILRDVKREASFAGSMRRKLVQMLNGIGLAARLGLDSCAALYTREHAHLHHTSAALRYPVFVRGRNYTGSAPDILRPPIFRRMLLEILAPELAAVPAALIMPLGDAVERSLCYLEAGRLLDGRRCLYGFPHPPVPTATAWRDTPHAAKRSAWP